MKRILLLVIFLISCSAHNYIIKRDYNFSQIKKIAVLRFKDYADFRNSGSVVSDYFVHKLMEIGMDVVYKNTEYENISDLSKLSTEIKVDAFLVGTVVKYVKEKKILVLEGETQEVSVGSNKTSIKVTNPKIIVTDTEAMWYPYQKSYDITAEIDIITQLIDAKTSDVVWSEQQYCKAIDLNIAMKCAVGPLCESLADLIPHK